MSNYEILKEYSLKQIKEVSTQYKLVSLIDINGKKIVGWNVAHKKPISEALKGCIERLNNSIIPDGYYYFCFSTAPRFNKDSHDKYLHLKGKAPANGAPHQQNQMQDNSKSELLSVTSALNYITQIAELKTENNRLTMELKRVTDENAVLEAELAELEREEGLSENKASDTMEFLKESKPAFMGALNEYFELQNKKIDLEHRKLNLIPQQNKEPLKRNVKTFETGTPDHLNYIRILYKNNKEEKMNDELDKLEQANPEQYQAICTELNLFENE